MAWLSKIFVANTKIVPSGIRRSFTHQSAELSGINLHMYPLNAPNSQEYDMLIQKGIEMMKNTGCATFPEFMTPSSIVKAVSVARCASKHSFVTDESHNAYQLSGADDSFPLSHVRNLKMRTQVASTAYDEIGPSSPLRKLYSYNGLVDFVGSIVGHQLFRLDDPLGACTVNIFRPGWEHAWHFDESEFTITLSLQQTIGGEFEYSPPIRNNSSELVADKVASIINTHSNYRCTGDSEFPSTENVKITTAGFGPGTLQIFAGRYSLHRVKPVSPKADKERLVAVLCFASEPNVVHSKTVQRMFWGRSHHEEKAVG